MSALRKIDASGFPAGPLGASAGAAPMLQWIAIADLRVDEDYQREIGAKGRTTIARIVAAFEWSKFAPVVVAPIEGGLYAVIDGQHRATAALIRGIEQVPCAVVIADKARQAEAFAAINGTVTAIGSTQLFHAKLAAGDPLAVKTSEICARAKVKILRSPRQAERLKAGETLAVGTLMQCAAAKGSERLELALRCITGTGDGNPGLLRSAIIKAFFDELGHRPHWCAFEDELLDALDTFPFARAWMESAVGTIGGGTVGARFGTRVVAHLKPKMAEVTP